MSLHKSAISYACIIAFEILEYVVYFKKANVINDVKFAICIN